MTTHPANLVAPLVQGLDVILSHGDSSDSYYLPVYDQQVGGLRPYVAFGATTHEARARAKALTNAVDVLDGVSLWLTGEGRMLIEKSTTNSRLENLIADVEAVRAAFGAK